MGNKRERANHQGLPSNCLKKLVSIFLGPILVGLGRFSLCPYFLHGLLLLRSEDGLFIGRGRRRIEFFGPNHLLLILESYRALIGGIIVKGELVFLPCWILVTESV